MFAKKFFITTAFAVLLIGVGAFELNTAQAQVQPQPQAHIQPQAQIQPQIIASCDCGQPSCQVCQSAEVEACGCGIRSCRGCLKRRERPCRQCPNCSAEVCISESKMEKEKRSCWKTEQKVICIPKVRLPWQKCDGPMCGKTKTITLLKKHSYECDVCKHKWKILEPELPKTDAAEPTPAKSAHVVPVIQGGNQALQYHSVPPQPPILNSLPYETVASPVTNPPIIRGNSGR